MSCPPEITNLLLILESFLPVVDQFVKSLDQCLQAYQEIAVCFSFFADLLEMSEETTKKSARKLLTAYPDYLDNTLVDKLCQFVAFAKQMTNKNISARNSPALHL